MRKLNIAVVFGGCSPEYGVSLESVCGVLENLDRDRFESVMVGITREGKWYHYTGSIRDIGADTWAESGNCTPAAILPDRGEGCLTVFRERGMEKIRIDAVFPVLHGSNGEDGSLHGLCQLAGLPVAGCGLLASALCMDKDRAHRLAAAAGIRVPASFVLDAWDDMARAEERAAELGYPLFVKPVKAGSSYGITRVSGPERLASAIGEAFRYDSRVIVEQAVPGFEVGCAVMGGERLITGEPDEIELSGGFFDFTEKYNLVTSAIHVPARVSREKTSEIKAATKTVYRALGCTGFARVDMFLRPDGELVFNEVNTIPGFTAHSRFPGMMRAAGMEFREVISRAIDLALEGEGRP